MRAFPLALLVAFAVSACGGDEGRVCDPGRVVACTCTSGVTGSRRCLQDASGYDECVCCTPDCSGRACGPDPTCGEECGSCQASQVCSETGQCEAPPCSSHQECITQHGLNWFCDPLSFECDCSIGAACAGKCAGDDGCGGICPNTCPAGLVCDPDSHVCVASESCFSGGDALPRSLEIPGADSNGIYDPDLEWDPLAQRLWIAYSSVEGPAGAGKVSTHLASSDDHGKTWCFAGVVNPSTIVPREEQPTRIAQDHAHWSHETPALFHDEDAPEEKRWNVAWHRYLHVEDNIPGNEDRHFEHGWIAIKSASSPLGLLNAPEEKLFSSLAYHVEPVIEAYNDAAPGGLPQRRFDSDPLLGDCLVFAEPGISAVNGRIEAALFCFRSQEQQDIVLVSYHHAAHTWRSVGTLLTTQDAQAVHQDLWGFNAPDIYETAGGWRLMVTPMERAYLGCIEYGLDLELGRLMDSNGDGPDPLYAYPKNPDPHVYQTGACTFHRQSETGVITGDVYTSGIQFRLVATGVVR